MRDNHHDITLTTLTYGGEAMGRLPDGRAVFVPFGLPGELVRLRLVQEKRSFARAELLEVLQPSPERITPKCRHFGVCSGCHYQNLSYERQLLVKTDILQDQLQRIGKIESPPIQPMMACPNPFNYRNHIQFHLTENGKLGFVEANTKSKVFPIQECHLPEDAINKLWPELEIEPNDEIARVSLRAGFDEDIMLVLESNSPEPPELEIEAGVSITHIYDNNTVVIAGSDHILINVKERDFRVSAPSFFRTNTLMAGKMMGYLLEKLTVSRSATLLDVYCGVGLFSAFFAPNCKRLIGIESSHSACEDFSVNLDEFNNVELYEGTAEEILPALANQVDTPTYILVDPPREGIDKQALDAILQIKPEMIAYVSCDPSTLARDASRLTHAGYQLSEVTPFDLSPQTYHIESISIFKHA